MKQGEFKRVITLPLLTFYGIGTILGAGIYVLIGKVAGSAGMSTPVAFLLAAVLAGFSAFSYAELASRFPRNAGEAFYVQEAFHRRWLAIVLGLMICSAGIISSAALLNGVAGYWQVFFSIPTWLIIIVTGLMLLAVVIWGVGESVSVAAVMTLMEIFGLILIIWVARSGFALLPEKVDQILPAFDPAIWMGILSGALLAFYAFIGFEDIVNIAEEVQQPVKTVPRAVILSLVVTTTFYILVAIVAITVVEPASLAQSDAPLALIYEQMTQQSPVLITIISLVSILNGVLIQMIMASRVLHGLHDLGFGPPLLQYIQPKTGTPLVAILFIGCLVLLLALLFDTTRLAMITSYIILLAFTLINLALWRIKLRTPSHPGFTTPLWVPIAGLLVSAGFILWNILNPGS